MLVECGKTKVLCTVSFTDKAPQWLQGQAWMTAEYSMLPGSTHGRKLRDGRGNRVDGRSYEIQRIIGRSLRSMVDLKALPEMTIWIDCDVLSADGGTRTTAINGAAVALYDAMLWLEEQRTIRKSPIRHLVSATSVGLVQGVPVVDLDYEEDAQAEVDMNVACTPDGRFVEVQSTAERSPFSDEQLTQMLQLARLTCADVNQKQRHALGL